MPNGEIVHWVNPANSSSSDSNGKRPKVSGGRKIRHFAESEQVETLRLSSGTDELTSDVNNKSIKSDKEVTSSMSANV